jgi:predicted DNA-binding transcriptional regulator AlpA
MEMAVENKSTTECRTYTVKDIEQILGISRNAAYALVKSKPGFAIVRIGSLIRIPIESFDNWFNSKNK